MNLAGIATFLAQKIVPSRYWEAERAKAATRRATLLWASLLLALVVYVLLKTD